MNELMQRRRALMAAAEKWDFAWDYTQGRLEDQDGWTSGNEGHYGSSLETNGQKLWANVGSLYNIYPKDSNPLQTMTNGIGVVECVFVGHFKDPGGDTNTRLNLRIHCAKDSTCRMSIMEYTSSNLPIKFRIMDNSTYNNSSILADFFNDIEYTVRIELNGATADIYINGVKIGNGISTSNIAFGTKNGVMIQTTGGSSYYALLKALRIKNGRL